MTYTDIGVRGASVQSWNAANPRDLLKRIIDNHAGSDRVAIFRLFVEKLKEEDEGEYLDTIIEYWFANNYHSLIVARASAAGEIGAARNRATAVEREEMVAAATAKLREKIVEEAEITLMEMMMPNGKQLADCTGQECAFLGRRFASWLGKVARRVKADETVRAILTEDDLRALYQKRD